MSEDLEGSPGGCPRLLLEHGAWVDATGPDGRTPLMYAAMLDRLEMLELLLGRGASAGRLDAACCTALDYARGMNAQRVISRLSWQAVLQRVA